MFWDGFSQARFHPTIIVPAPFVPSYNVTSYNSASMGLSQHITLCSLLPLPGGTHAVSCRSTVSEAVCVGFL